jgi:hypothetical protein
MFKKILAAGAATLLAVGLSVVAVTVPVSATGYPSGDETNQPVDSEVQTSEVEDSEGEDGEGEDSEGEDGEFDYNWQYDAPTCTALTVAYPANIPAGQANDVNVRIKYGASFATELTLNFHNNVGTWSGTRVFTYATHPNWPANIGPYKVVWTQVGGTNYHWEGSVSCSSLPADSSASVSVTPATCSAAAQLVLNTPVNATWGSVSGAYSVTATATSGHTFAGGALTQTFTGTLAAQLSPTDPSCAPPAVCIPRSAVSYTYDPATNSGVITVGDVANSTGQLCQGFWVTATSWRYTTSGVWPQILDVVQKLPKITTPGTYPYVATVTCGQGDIYASFNGQVDPTPTLSGPSGWETFLHNMGFVKPNNNPTYVQQATGCNNVTPTTPTAKAITECGTYGSVSVPADTESIDYTLTGNGTTGINKVTAVAKPGYVLTGYPSGGWTFNLGAFTDCSVAINLTYIQECTPDADNTWRVYNPTANTIQVSYAAYGGGPSGTHSATPGYSYFTTPRATETMIINWGAAGSGIAVGSKTKASGNDLASTDPACVKLVEPVAPDLKTTTVCGTYGSVTPATTVGVDYAVVFDQETGDYTVTATPKSGYYFAANKTEVVFSGNVGAYVLCVVEPTVSYELGVCYPNGTEPDRFSSKNVYITLDNTGSETAVTFHVVGAADVNSASPGADIVRTVAAGDSVVVETTPIWDQGGSYVVEFTATGYTIPNGEIVIPAFVGCLDGNPADPSYSNQQCVAGVLIGGSITVELIEGFTYTITGPNGFEWVSADVDTVTGLEPGEYTVTVEAAEGYVLTGDTVWPYTVTIDEPVHCSLIPIPVIVPQDITCDADGSYTLPLIDGVTWYVDGVETAAGPHAVTAATTLTLTATLADDTYGWDGALPDPWQLVFTDPTGCISNDAFAKISTLPATCEEDGSVDLAETSLLFATWDAALPTTPGSHTVTATAAEGHVFAGGETTKSFNIVIETQLSPLDEECGFEPPTLATVYPKVSSTPLTCSTLGSYTIGALDAGTVQWTVNGGPKIAGGTFPVSTTSQVTLAAYPTNPDDTLATDSLDNPTWVNPIVLQFTKPNAADCGLELTTLALTGLGGGLGLTLAGGLVFLGIGGFLIFLRRRQVTAE